MAMRPGFAKLARLTAQRAARRVLIADANPLNMKLFGAVIAAEGYRVLEASDGPAALDLAHRSHPDAIVLDVSLPGLSGLEIVRRLKAAADTRDIPILATSSGAGAQVVERARAAGSEAFIAKPIAIGELLGAIDDVLAAQRGFRPAAAA